MEECEGPCGGRDVLGGDGRPGRQAPALQGHKELRLRICELRLLRCCERLIPSKWPSAPVGVLPPACSFPFPGWRWALSSFGVCLRQSWRGCFEAAPSAGPAVHPPWREGGTRAGRAGGRQRGARAARRGGPVLPHLANFRNPCEFKGLIATQKWPAKF